MGHGQIHRWRQYPVHQCQPPASAKHLLRILGRSPPIRPRPETNQAERRHSQRRLPGQRTSNDRKRDRHRTSPRRIRPWKRRSIHRPSKPPTSSISKRRRASPSGLATREASGGTPIASGTIPAGSSAQTVSVDLVNAREDLSPSTIYGYRVHHDQLGRRRLRRREDVHDAPGRPRRWSTPCPTRI